MNNKAKTNDENESSAAVVICGLTTDALFLIAMLVICLAMMQSSVHCQTPPKTDPGAKPAKPEPDCFNDHATDFDFYNSLRIRPIEITEITDSTIQYKFTDRGSIRLFSVNLSPRTIAPAALRTEFEKRKFLLVFCDKHAQAHLIEPVKKSKN